MEVRTEVSDEMFRDPLAAAVTPPVRPTRRLPPGSAASAPRHRRRRYCERGDPDMVVTDIITARIAGYDLCTSPLTGRSVTEAVDVDVLLHAVGEVLDGH